MSAETEEWRPVVGFEGYYEVSSLGRVRSLDRFIDRVSKLGNPFKQFREGVLLAPGPHTGGYVSVHIYRAGRQRATVVHNIVAEAFIGPRPPGMEILHGDGNKKNNSAGNLRYGTKAENEADKDLHGSSPKGEKHPSSKLTATAVLEIRRRAGEPQQDLADEFGCTFSNISAIQLRKSWRHV